MPLAKVTALIPCAGQGKRMGGSISKQYMEILGRPLLAYTLDKFQGHSLIDEIILIPRAEEIAYCDKEVVKKYGFTKVAALVPGGEERQDSVWQGLCALGEETGWVVIHDGVRPLVTGSVISAALETAFLKGAAVVGVPVKDTVKRVNPDLTVSETPPRESLWLVQTPQVFRKDIVLNAYQKAFRLGWRGTDDASLVERMGVKVQMVRGEYDNIKVTTPEDLILVRETVRVVR
jgi:2-C-methyl-D-erythritol 4-phosphate cytidylyltransferase